MIINHNMSAAYANRTLGLRTDEVQSSIEKLSSGMRINQAADDASGLAVSEKLRAQVRGLNQASRNIGNGVSFIQTTEGFLQNTQDILHRIRELSVQSANGIYSSEDRAQIQVEVSQLVDEVNRISEQAQFNGIQLLDGTLAEGGTIGGLTFQVGANLDQNETVTVGSMTAEALNLVTPNSQNNSIDLTDASLANDTIGVIDVALQAVSKQRADLGAYQTRFEMAQKGVDIAAENLTAAESRIRDADMANEIVDYTRSQILTQASTAMLAQANTVSQSVLQLLG